MERKTIGGGDEVSLRAPLHSVNSVLRSESSTQNSPGILEKYGRSRHVSIAKPHSQEWLCYLLCY
jgi:hypothetical protein